MLSRRRAIGLLVFLLMAFLGLVAHAETLPNQFVDLKPPRAAPALIFQDGKGQTFSLQDLRGHYILLNLWATWCGPCADEMPDLDKLQAHFTPDRLFVIALTQDHNGIAAAGSFFARHNIRHLPVFADTTGMAPSVFGVEGIPTTFLIDPHGMVLGYVNGETEWMAPQSLALLERKIRP